MVRKLAVAAAVVGVCAFITPSFAKGGGAMGGFHAAPRATGLAPNFARRAPSMRARPPLFTGLAPHFVAKPGLRGRHFAFRRFHQRRLGHALAFGYGFAIAAPVVYEVPQYEEPAPGAVALWRGNGAGTCSSETVQVRGARGMDEVTVTRC
ncbi:MAG TPA: CHAP domain-containing protein [Xanthobacteraceae bacterium]|nr:CHAP domain-containing protein [Xanthobacteraceae bacterium]